MASAALENFRRAGEGRRIHLIPGEAVELLEHLDAGPFDFIFLDGAHGHYLRVFQALERLCKKGTFILSDNVLYKGMTDVYKRQKPPCTKSPGPSGTKRRWSGTRWRS